MNDQVQPEPTANNRRKFFIIGVILILVLGGFIYWLMGRGKVSTDDAQISGDLVPISPRVAGYVDYIAVHDNQQVNAGDVLVQLDRHDLEARVQRAEADLATQQAQTVAAQAQLALTQRTAPSGASQAEAGIVAAQAGVAAANKQVAAAHAQVRASQAALRAAQAEVKSATAQAAKAAADAARYQQLYSQGAISKQQLDAVNATNTSAQAALDSARDRVSAARASEAQVRTGVGQAVAGLGGARAQVSRAQAAHAGAATTAQQVGISSAQQKAAASRIQQSLADLQNARLQLSYTTITAPVAGQVSQKSAEPGQYVQPGQLLMALVPLRNVWVVANFKETQIGKMRPGQLVDIEVDSYPGKAFRGKIHSIGAATGSKFSLLPSENATGNFVKVVQRIPVKIVFDQQLPREVILRPGQNVVATVHLQ